MEIINRSFCLSLLLSFLLFATASSLFTIPQFELTSKYIQTGATVLDTSPYYGNTSSNALQSDYFSLTFYGNITSYDAVSTIQSMRYDISSSDRRFNITAYVCGYNANGLDICMRSASFSQLYSLSIRYLVLDAAFTKITHFYGFARFYVQLYGNNTFDKNNPLVSNFNVPAGLSMTGTVKAIVLLNGFNGTASDSTNSFDIKITARYLTSTIFQVTTSSGMSTPVYASFISYCIIGYNQDKAMKWPFPAARITLGTFSPSFPFINNNTLLSGFNTFWGATWMNISTDNFVQFDSFLNLYSNISVNTSNAGGQYQFFAMIFEFKECHSTTPYYMIAEDRCYDICPNRYYESNVQMTCENCTAYDCLKCISSGTCTSCDNTTDHRQLNNATGRCVPVAGFYESNVTVALPCDGSCKTCENASVLCTSCFDGDYLNANSCVPCMNNCTICINGSFCSNCSNGLVQDGMGGCVGGYDCSSISNCVICDLINGCSQCSPGYSLVNASTCSGVCGDGIWIPSEECDDNNTANGDGCSSSCTIEAAFFCLNSNLTISICGPCSPNCLNCTTAVNCSLCGNSFSLFSNFTGDFCQADCSNVSECYICHITNSSQTICDTCNLGYGLSNNLCNPICGDGFLMLGEECDDGNNANGDGCDFNCSIEAGYACTVPVNTSVCVLCNAGTYQAANKTMCLPCANYDCFTCDISGNCTSCSSLSNRQMNTNSSRCDPKQGFFDDGVNQLAPPCDSSCLTCSSNGTNNCNSCNSGRIINGSSCPSCSDVAGPGCSSCSSSGGLFVCTGCVGSTLTGGLCIFSLPEKPSGPNLLLFILLPLLAALLCCCLILFIVWRRRKNEQNKVDEDMQQNEIVKEKTEEPNDPFEEKILTSNKKKYRGGPPSNLHKTKKRRAPLVHETEQNELSMEEFKETMQVIPKKKEGMKKGLDQKQKNPPLNVNKIQDCAEGKLEQQMQIASQKHVVSSGQEQLPPQPQKEQVHSLKSENESEDIFHSEASDQFNEGRGR